MTDLCKYAHALEETVIDDDPEASADFMRMCLASHGVCVGTTTIKAHRRKLCKCFTIYEAASPGPDDSGLEARPKVDLPKPMLEMDESGGTLVTAPRPATDVPPTHAELFEEYGLDAADWTILSVGHSKRQANSGEWFESHRASFKPRPSSESIGLSAGDMQEIIDAAKGRTAQVSERADEGSAFLAPAGDLQMGKIDGGGTRGILDRYTALLMRVRDDFVAQKGREGLSTIVAPWLGDCIEGFVSQNGKLATRQDVWPSEQVALIQRVMMLAVETFSEVCGRVVVPVVPGNHDETQRFAATGGTDSWAVHAGSSVLDTIKKVREYSPDTFAGVEFVFPQRGELTATVDVCGSRIVNLHGHQFRGGVNGAEKWLAGHSLGRQAAGDADVLMCAHLHHFHAKEVGQGQLVLQIPAIDGGSDWFRQKTGETNPPGKVSVMTRNGEWRRLTRYTEK